MHWNIVLYIYLCVCVPLHTTMVCVCVCVCVCAITYYYGVCVCVCLCVCEAWFLRVWCGSSLRFPVNSLFDEGEVSSPICLLIGWWWVSILCLLVGRLVGACVRGKERECACVCLRLRV